MMEQLRNIMTSEISTVRANQTCQDAAALMSEHNIGAIPVVDDNGHMVGMVTDRDITLRATAEGQASNTPVSEVMTDGHLIQGSPDMNAHEAAQLMAQNQVRRLPVVENGRIVGIVALGDLATNEQLDEDAEQALSSISTPSEPQ
jgi:CBS domain-containing protein